MLDGTFIHLPDYGPRRERRLWECGVTSWEEFLDRFGASPYHKSLCARVASSRYALRLSDSSFFSSALPSGESWRAFPHFPKIAYLDIETTGLAPETDYVTVIGVFDGEKAHSFVHGQNLDEFAPFLKRFDAVVTFNGSMFDLPFIRKKMKGTWLPPLHIDLRFVLQSIGVRGGLKKIEEKFGYEREDDLKGMTGYDAVKLWQAYVKRNDKDALDKLVRYNSADISNLKKLMEWAYNEKRLRTGFDEITRNGEIKENKETASA
ncbi:MAG: ribonuclease H-like domain-containing protein [Candidatus Micrarchaeota archaeon]